MTWEWAFLALWDRLIQNVSQTLVEIKTEMEGPVKKNAAHHPVLQARSH